MPPLPSTRDTGPAALAGPFRILTVCTGNVCRSPLVEAALRQRLAAGVRHDGAVVASSAGTGALVGAPVDAEARVEADRLALEVDEHRGRALVTADVAASTLIVTATRDHRAAVVDADPSAVRRTFTLLELDAVLETLEPADVPPAASEHVVDRLAAVVAAAATRRGHVASHRELDLDLRDPYRLGPEVHRAVATTIDESTARIVDRLVALARPA